MVAKLFKVFYAARSFRGPEHSFRPSLDTLNLFETRKTNLVTASCNQNVALTFFLSNSQSTGGPRISRIHYIRFLVKLVLFLTIVRFLALILAKIQMVPFQITCMIFLTNFLAIRGPPVEHNYVLKMTKIM